MGREEAGLVPEIGATVCFLSLSADCCPEAILDLKLIYLGDRNS